MEKIALLWISKKMSQNFFRKGSGFGKLFFFCSNISLICRMYGLIQKLFHLLMTPQFYNACGNTNNELVILKSIHYLISVSLAVEIPMLTC